ncbi:dUTPase-like protein [Neurospora crassa]|nr:dUTPase-like protein [Neurospora crassa]
MFVARRLLLSRPTSSSLPILSQTTTTFKDFFATITPMTTGTTEPTTSSPPAKRIKTSADSSSQTTTAATTTAATMTADTQTPVTKVDQAPPLLIKKLSDKARLPTRGSAFAAGYDIYASKETTIPARGKGLVDTDISMAVPAGTYGRIAPRSGLAAKNFIDVGAGVIDADYRGQVKVLLFNHSDVDFVVNEGDRVAQLVLERIYNPEVVEVEQLEESVRGAGGFGSTGVSSSVGEQVKN